QLGALFVDLSQAPDGSEVLDVALDELRLVRLETVDGRGLGDLDAGPHFDGAVERLDLHIDVTAPGCGPPEQLALRVVRHELGVVREVENRLAHALYRRNNRYGRSPMHEL